MTEEADKVECAACGRLSNRRRCRAQYVEAFGVQYVCFTCRKQRTYDEVMDALLHGPVYVRGTRFKNITEKEKAMKK